jgi:hypothetical protein
LWCRSLRNDTAWPFGAIAGITYTCLVGTWKEGYVFASNLLALHVIALVLIGRYSKKLQRAYSIFFVIGTIGATQVPVVGWMHLQSIDQLVPAISFLVVQLAGVCEADRKKKKQSFIEVRIVCLNGSQCTFHMHRLSLRTHSSLESLVLPSSFWVFPSHFFSVTAISIAVIYSCLQCTVQLKQLTQKLITSIYTMSIISPRLDCCSGT